MILVLVVFIVITASAAWYWRSLQAQASSKNQHTSAITHKTDAANTARKPPLKKAQAHKVQARDDGAYKYHAVSIQCKDDACAAAKEIARTRFLTQAAPALPLPSCDAAQCNCGYVHHRDRRAEDDERRSMHGLQTELYPQTTGRERRYKKDRRKRDVN